MFEEYSKKLEELGENVPKVFKTVAKKGAIHARNYAVKLTDTEKLVDTGAYKRNWNAEVIKTENNTYAIVFENSMEYASFLEDGYNIEKSYFLPFEKMEGSPKSNKIINALKAKYQGAKGFMVKPRRFKGRKIGRRTMNDTEGHVLMLLFEEIEALMLAKKLGVTKAEAKKLIK